MWSHHTDPKKIGSNMEMFDCVTKLENNGIYGCVKMELDKKDLDKHSEKYNVLLMCLCILLSINESTEKKEHIKNMANIKKGKDVSSFKFLKEYRGLKELKHIDFKSMNMESLKKYIVPLLKMWVQPNKKTTKLLKTKWTNFDKIIDIISSLTRFTIECCQLNKGNKNIWFTIKNGYDGSGFMALEETDLNPILYVFFNKPQYTYKLDKGNGIAMDEAFSQDSLKEYLKANDLIQFPEQIYDYKYFTELSYSYGEYKHDKEMAKHHKETATPSNIVTINPPMKMAATPSNIVTINPPPKKMAESKQVQGGSKEYPQQQLAYQQPVPELNNEFNMNIRNHTNKEAEPIGHETDTVKIGGPGNVATQQISGMQFTNEEGIMPNGLIGPKRCAGKKSN